MSITLPEAPTQAPPTPDPKRTVGELLDELEAIGDVNMIAGLLEAEGILATPCNAGMCAVAIYLQRYSGIDELNVGTEDVLRWMSAEDGGDWRWPLGPTVREFVSAFDAGEYPELLWPEIRTTYVETDGDPEAIAGFVPPEAKWA